MFSAPDELVSAIALRKALAICRCTIWIQDEFGRDIAMASKTRSGNAFEAITLSMKAFTSFEGGLKEAPRQEKGKGAPAVPHPALSGLAMTAPDPLFNSLHTEDVEGGMLGRRIYLSADNPDDPFGDWPYRPNQGGSATDGKLPKSVLTAIRRLLEIHAGKPPLIPTNLDRVRELAGMSAARMEDGRHIWKITPDAGAVAAIEQLKIQMPKLKARVAQTLHPVYDRSLESVARLAALFALSDAAADPNSDLHRVICQERHVLFALEVCMASLKLIGGDMAAAASETDADKLRKRLLRLVKSHAAKKGRVKHEGRWWATRRLVKRSLLGGSGGFKGSEVAREYEALLDAGMIVETDAPAKGASGAGHPLNLVRAADSRV